jgi:2-oxoacid dehydrogenases acyltransferase (catalytic domain)
MARNGTLVTDAPPYRRLAAMLTTRRNDAVVYFEEAIDVTDTLPWIERWNASGKPRLTLFVVALYALAKTLHAHPRLNRFVTGGRLYQRDGVWLSFTTKRSMEPAAPLVIVKRRFEPEETLEDFARAMSDRIRTARVDGDRDADREFDALLKIPHPILRRVLALAPWAQSVGLLPAWFMRQDPFFTSAFVSNLGSFGGATAYHHLYEHGDSPLFGTFGRASDEVVARDGHPVVRTVARMRFSYDERIEDGFNAVRATTHFRGLVEAPDRLL